MAATPHSAIEGRVEFLRPGTTRPIATVSIPRGTLLTEPIVDGDFSAALPAPDVLPSGRYLVRVILDIGASQDIGAEQELTISRTVPANESVR